MMRCAVATVLAALLISVQAFLLPAPSQAGNAALNSVRSATHLVSNGIACKAQADHSSTRQRQRQLTLLAATSVGDGNTGGGSRGGSGGGGGGGDSSSDGDAADDDYEGLPAALAAAVSSGQLPKEALKRYRELAQSPLTRFFIKFDPWRARLLGDRAFIIKLGIEITNGVLAQTLAEYEKRRGNFFKEFDYVLADILTSCFANFAAVWTSCPTMAVAAAGAGAATQKGVLAGAKRFMQSCPSNAFQKVPASAAAYTLKQRAAALIIPMPELFVIGFAACAAGYGLTSVMSFVRSKLNPDTPQSTESAPIIKTSLAIGAFLAVSSNLRYQIIAGGLEQRVLDTVFASQPMLSNAGSLLLRTGNLYLGATQIVDWLRIVGVQQSTDDKPVAQLRRRKRKLQLQD